MAIRHPDLESKLRQSNRFREHLGRITTSTADKALEILGTAMENEEIDAAPLPTEPDYINILCELGFLFKVSGQHYRITEEGTRYYRIQNPGYTLKEKKK